MALHAAVERGHCHNFPPVVTQLGHVLVSLGAFTPCHHCCWVEVENLAVMGKDFKRPWGIK